MRSGEKAGCAIISFSLRGNPRRMMLPAEHRQHPYFFIMSSFLHSISSFLHSLRLRRGQSGIDQGWSAPQGEPSREVVAQRCPRGFQSCFQAAATAELPQAAAFFNPGVGKLREARALSVNLLGFFRGHLGLEGQGGRGFLAARNRPHPGRACFRRGALTAQRAGPASRLRRAIDVDANSRLVVLRRLVSQGFSRRASEAIRLGIIGEGAAQRVAQRHPSADGFLCGFSSRIFVDSLAGLKSVHAHGQPTEGSARFSETPFAFRDEEPQRRADCAHPCATRSLRRWRAGPRLAGCHYDRNHANENQHNTNPATVGF